MDKIDEIIISTKEYEEGMKGLQKAKAEVEILLNDNTKDQKSKIESLHVLKIIEEEKVQNHNPSIFVSTVSVLITLFVLGSQQAMNFFMKQGEMKMMIMEAAWTVVVFVMVVLLIINLLSERKIKKESVKAKYAIVAIDECIKSLETSDQNNKC